MGHAFLDSHCTCPYFFSVVLHFPPFFPSFFIPSNYLWKKIMGDKLLVLSWNVKQVHEAKDEEVGGHHVEPHQDHRTNQS